LNEKRVLPKLAFILMLPHYANSNNGGFFENILTLIAAGDSVFFQPVVILTAKVVLKDGFCRLQKPSFIFSTCRILLLRVWEQKGF